MNRKRINIVSKKYLKKVILACAGAGKTNYICKSIDETVSTIILAFTNENIKNIYDNLASNGKDLNNVKVMTFHSFIYNYLIKPYENIIKIKFKKKFLQSAGVNVIYDPPKRFEKHKINHLYKNKTSYKHYYDENSRIYVNRLSELIIFSWELIAPEIKEFFKKFYNSIYIDEVQDFRNHDWELLKRILTTLEINFILVGDFYQHSVSGSNNSGKPFQKKKYLYTDYKEYCESLKNLGLEVDTHTLSKSYRCSENITSFIKKYLKINIDSLHKNEGEVIIVKSHDDASSIFNDDKITKLLYMESNKYKFNAINWGYSKGDTFLNTAVVLTKSIEDDLFDKDNNLKEMTKIKQNSLNKFYVSLTRSKGNVYIIKNSVFLKLKKQYLL